MLHSMFDGETWAYWFVPRSCSQQPAGGCLGWKRSPDLTRFAIQAKGPDGKWTRKPLAYRESNNVHLLIARPPEICVNLVFKQMAGFVFPCSREVISHRILSWKNGLRGWLPCIVEVLQNK